MAAAPSLGVLEHSALLCRGQGSQSCSRDDDDILDAFLNRVLIRFGTMGGCPHGCPLRLGLCQILCPVTGYGQSSAAQWLAG